MSSPSMSTDMTKESTMDIVSWVFANDAYDQDTAIYINSNNPAQFLTAGEMRQQVRRLIAGLKHIGLNKGDCVCVHTFNDVSYSNLVLGIMGAGGIFSGANPGSTVQELTHHLRITQAKYLITNVRTLETAWEAAAAVGIPRSRIFTLNAGRETDRPDDDEEWEHLLARMRIEGSQSWWILLSYGEADWVSVDDPHNTVAAYFSTSGTSGLPKAAIITHSYLLAEAEAITANVMAASASYEVFHLIAVPPFHGFCIPVQHFVPLRTGTPLYLMPRFQLQGFLNAVERYRITRTMMVPPMLVALEQSSTVSEKLVYLRQIFVGGSVLKDAVQQNLYAKLSAGARIEQVYGMSEAGWATIWQREDRDQAGSIGQPMAGKSLRLVDIDGNIINEDGVHGEIHIGNPNKMKGYLNNPSANAEIFSEDGWIRTGDVGFVRDGDWYVIDRTKDMIKLRGWQVSPVEIETTLLSHPEIIDAGVIGIISSDGSEAPHAFIHKLKDSHLDEEGVKAFLSGRLSRYKNVAKATFVDEIPRSAAGKILRRVLREQLRVITTDSVESHQAKETGILNMAYDSPTTTSPTDSIPSSLLRSSSVSTYETSDVDTPAIIGDSGIDNGPKVTVVSPVEVQRADGHITPETDDPDFNEETPRKRMKTESDADNEKTFI